MLDISLELVQVIVQAGAVGLMLVSIVLGYKIARLAINKGFEFVNNHLIHNTEAVEKSVEVMREMSAEIKNMSSKLDIK